jgi:DNA-binding NarL/FixJ family response regulator
MTTRALVVDDDVPTRVGVRTILASDPEVEVVGEAATGNEAVAMARELQPDVVLMDVQLPDLDGIEATRRILEESETWETVPRIIMLTTFDLDEYVYRSVQAGASGFLLKRTRAEELIDTVLAIADGNELPAPTRQLIEAFVDPSSLPAATGPLRDLSAREREVLALIATGRTNVEIADDLGLSIETVRTHVKRIYAKAGIRDRAHAVIVAYETGLVARSG